MKRRKWTWRGLACVAVLAAAAGPAAAQGPSAAKPPAVVNGQVITRAELDAAIRQLGPTPVELPEEHRRQRDAEVLMALIDNALFTQFLAQNAPAAPADVEKRLNELKAELTRSKKTFPEYLADTGNTEASLRTFIAQHLQWETYTRQHITDADVQKYYNDYKDFFDGVLVRASHIYLMVPAGAPEEVRKKATAQLNELRGQIAAGKLDFAEAAKKYSQCPSAPNGGDLGEFPRKWAMDENFARTAFALQIGQVSEVVQSEYGLHLIKVTGRRTDPKSAAAGDFNQIKAGVREMCVEDLRQSVLVQLRKAGRIEINLP
jgi:peptidyl-prolyl cis-trans isomerase C